MKAKGMKFNFYFEAKTLQIQGKENANQLRADLIVTYFAVAVNNKQADSL